MKIKIAVLLTLSVFLSLTDICMADNPVKSLLGVPFGQTCTIKAEFIDKPNTYYAQNISHAEYYLKIIEINNEKLSEPIIAEPVYENMKVEKSRIYNLKAYEKIYSDGKPDEWSNAAQQISYMIINKIVIKPLE